MDVRVISGIILDHLTAKNKFLFVLGAQRTLSDYLTLLERKCNDGVLGLFCAHCLA